MKPPRIGFSKCWDTSYYNPFPWKNIIDFNDRKSVCWSAQFWKKSMGWNQNRSHTQSWYKRSTLPICFKFREV